MSLDIDVGAFKRRVGMLQTALGDEKLEGSTAWASVLGKGDDETQKQLAITLHFWLLGVPFANTCIIITKEKAVIIAAAKQTRHLEPLKSSKVEIVTRGKEPAEIEGLLKDVLTNNLSIDPEAKFAVFGGDKPESPIAAAFRKVYESHGTVDGTDIFASLLQIKDESELRSVRMASKAASGIVSQFFVDKMSGILDEGSKVSNEALAKSVGDAIDNAKLLSKLKIGSEFNASELDWVIPPQVNENSAGNVGANGIIRISMTPSYRSYSAYIQRTYMVNASPQQQSNYQLLLGAQRRAIQAAVVGNSPQDVWQAAHSYIESKAPHLLAYLASPLGHEVGLAVPSYQLELKDGNATKFADDETLTVTLTLQNVQDEIKSEIKDEEDVKPQLSPSYTLSIADTLRIDGTEPIVFTDAAKASSDVAFELEEPDEGQSREKKRAVKAESPAATRRPRATRAAEQREATESAERAIEEHQSVLKSRLQEAGVQKYANTEDTEVQDTGPVFHKFESYKREAQLPQIGNLRISVDPRAHSVLVPINGRPVPFHINTFRSGNTTDEGQYVFLRLNFNSPDSTMAKRDDVPYDDADAQFLKSITLRSRDGERMRDTLRRIQDLKKETMRRDNERRQLADVVEQGKLQESKDRRPLRMEQVFVRPVPEGKRLPGGLEIHRNGVRYTSPLREQTVEVLFSNVSNLFFQPNDHEVITLIHFHLKNPILIGKRKTKDVQFYRDATDMTADDTGHRKRRYRYGDEDELEQEQEERRLRVRMNREFYNFAEEIARASRGQLEVDTPFRELGFNGVPHRANMFLQPTTNCLVQLSETPFFVVELNQVELCVLERVRFGLKQFDIVFIYKDYKLPVTQVNSVPMTQLDSVKSWLNEVDIPFFEAELNFNWKEVMNTINSSPRQFFLEDGGWSFLDPEAPLSENGEEDEEEDDDEPGEEEFSASDADPDDESEEFSEEGSGSDFDEEDDGSDAASSEPSGEDWSDLEEEAMREDRKKERRED